MKWREPQKAAETAAAAQKSEVREILRNAVSGMDEPPTRLGSRIAARFEPCGLEHDIAELRGQLTRPAQFDEQ